MKIPKSIKIGCHNIPIEYPYEFVERYDNYAQWDCSRMRIMIGNVTNSGEKRPDTAILVVLIHEILHAIEDITQHGVFRAMGEKNEEAVQGFAECIAQILIDNKFIKLEK